MGVLYAILAALAFALWNIYLQRGLSRGASARLAVVTLALSEIACFLPVTLWLAWRGALPLARPTGLLWFLLAGLLSSIAGPTVAAHATRRIGAAQTTALRLLDPFFAYVIAAFFLSQRIYGRAIGGMVLLAVALILLQRDRAGVESPLHLDRAGGAPPAHGPGSVRILAHGPDKVRLSGIGFAIAASLVFTVGSVFRKVGLALIPSAIVAGTTEGVAGMLGVAAIVLAGSGWNELRMARRADYRDLWWSGLAAAAGTLFLNLALQRVPVPIAVALRNTSPWFVLALVPLLIGAQHRPGRWTWASTALLTAGMLLVVLR